ncbi:TPA: attachment protein [Pseudomonas aeruginosa]|uniref:attachment protein n=3 Tax=Pseudomonas aeruginosa TaxID=287 RepID=UPI000405AB97|nr:attachment protein [Pseudomonas aeruginosa]EKN7498931.1 attachment protein [Pseudomonas aeruginosa]EKV5556864.1 attachment protein [Pseudomonas aeruginosa]MBH4027534.1 attachment protein [Pseudomonas aeruginosa]MBI7415332.1 attachment protein [Pseudomonas aeruginosa]MBI8736972.1 attachment protein [Pseudomonas aeruginosa]
MACLLPSLFFAQGVSAEVFWWQVNGIDSLRDKPFGSPGEGCSAVLAYFQSQGSGYSFTFNYLRRNSDVEFSCSLKRLDQGEFVGEVGASIGRYGDTCPTGTEYDAAVGECKSPPKECEVGTPNLFRSSNYPIIVINGKNTVPSSPPSGCLSGCAYEADSSRPTSCYRTPGSTTEGFCNYTLKSNGQNCSADSGNLGGTGPSLSEPNQPPVTDPPSDPNDPGCPKGYSWSGTTCVKTPTDPTDPTDPKDPGGDGGGTGGGGTGGGGDGGTGGGDGGAGGGDGKCDPAKDPNKCQGNGSGGGGDGKCDPAKDPNKCQGTGGGGTGQCDPAKDPNKCQGGSSISGDGDCKVAIQCNGDAIQCAIVRQEKAARCADEEFRTVDDKKIQDLKNTLAGEFSGPEYEPIKATGENTHDLSKLLDTSGRFSKACPVIPDVSFPWFGSTQTVSLSSVSSDLCTYLQWFGYLLVAFAMRAAAEIIARGLN